MSDKLHIVCPHCQGVNRIPAARLSDDPRCGKCKQPLFQGRPLEVDEATFQRHLSRSDVPLVVDFWAEWCGPCKMMAPMFAQAAVELEPGVRLLKVDTERNQNLAAQYGIRSIPTLAIFRGGSEVTRQAGAMQAPQLIQWVRGAL
ncbi:MAG: thioredoxin TrxC [Pseudomonadota bacterium]